MSLPCNVRGLAYYGGELVAAGDFMWPGIEGRGTAAYDGREWRLLGGGTNGPVDALVVWNGKLIAAGSFTTAGPFPARHIAAWDGAAWENLGDGLAASPSALCVYRGEPIVAVPHRSSDNGYQVGLFAWDGVEWTAFAAGEKLDGEVCALAAYGGDLYVAGSFGNVGEIPSVSLARWIPDGPKQP
jgi:hypothetical protein